MIKRSILAPVLLLFGLYLFLDPGGSDSITATFVDFWPILLMIPLLLWGSLIRPIHLSVLVPIHLLMIGSLVSLAIFSINPVLPRFIFVQPIVAMAILLGGIWLMFIRKQDW